MTIQQYVQMKHTIFLFFSLLFLIQFVSCTKKSFTFVQFSDPQMGFISNNANVDAEKKLLTEAVNYVNSTKPAFVVITGDLVNKRTDTNQINAFKKIISLIDKNIPVYLIPGNHDIGQNPTAEEIDFYFKYNNYDRFSFNHEGVCFIGLNSCYIKGGVIQEQEQLEWLKNVFSNNKNSRKIIFTHHPFFINDIDEEEAYFNIPVEKRKVYFDLFKENNTRVVFAGHHHNNGSANYKGIDMIITSSIGKQLGNFKPGFREITVYPDSITHKYIEINTSERFSDAQ